MSSPDVLARSGDSRLRFRAGGVVMEVEAKNLGLLISAQPVLYLWRDDPYRVTRYELQMWGTNPRTQVERQMPILYHTENQAVAFDPRETVIDVPLGGFVFISLTPGLPSGTFDYDGGHFALVKISGNGVVDGCYPDDRTPWLLTVGRGVLFVAAALAVAYVVAPAINGAIASAGAETAAAETAVVPATSANTGATTLTEWQQATAGMGTGMGNATDYTIANAVADAGAVLKTGQDILVSTAKVLTAAATVQAAVNGPQNSAPPAAVAPPAANPGNGQANGSGGNSTMILGVLAVVALLAS